MKSRLFPRSILATVSLGVGTLGAWACSEPVKVQVPTGSDNFVDLSGEDPTSTDGTSTLVLDNACITQTSAAEQRKVAIYLMLDSSGSMEEPTGTGATKWQAIQRAIRNFLDEARTSDLSMGLQFFPLAKPGSSFTCETQDDCGDDGGPCFLSTCLLGGTISLCRTDADCPGSAQENPCVDFGLCENSDPASPTACVLGSPCGGDLGRCQDFERTCTQATDCRTDAYSTPAVEIGLIDSTIVAIDQALSDHAPEGLTPTAPALQGAIDHAREWAQTHPDQAVVTVLATDGLPTDCGEEQNAVPSGVAPPNAASAVPPLDQVIAVASAAAADPALPIRTFAIGVFQQGDGTSINNVNAIARAGGTGDAVFIDTEGEVETQFLDALRSISSGTLACQFQIPQSETALDYSRVNLAFNDGTGRQQLGFVRDEAGCAANPNSWHYDVDASISDPSAIQVCPAVCDQFKASATSGSISLQLGCATIIR